MLKIAGGTIYDPTNTVDGVVGDLWIDGGRIVAPPPPGVKPTRTLDARGLVVMPGGVDLHCHIAGPKVNAGRRMQADEKRTADGVMAARNGLRSGTLRSGTLGSVPSTFATGYKYAGLGYTTAFDAAVTPLAARQAHHELADTPCLDKGFFTLVGNNHYVMEAIAAGEPERVEAFLAWLLGRTKAYAPKLVNPGGVETWKQTGSGAQHGLDDPVPTFGVTPRQIITQLVTAANNLGLPHPAHIHCNQLGMPGNWRTTLETLKALGDLRGHLTHIQFHSYGGGDADETTLRSRVPDLVEYVNTHPNVTVDVGQVMFGATTSMTGDGPLGYFLHQLSTAEWYSHDTECESGCGVMPIKYRNKNLFNALQWAIGLEWFLLSRDPWRVALSTDHPNGGTFAAYPQLIHLLMDRNRRREVLATCPQALASRSTLADLDREYSLSEIAIITRAAPARILGLTNKGHLGVDADADVTLYQPNSDLTAMFELPRYVVKAGEVLVDDGELRSAPAGQTLSVAPSYDEERLTDLPEWFAENYSLNLANYGVRDEDLAPLAP